MTIEDNKRYIPFQRWQSQLYTSISLLSSIYKIYSEQDKRQAEVRTS